MVQQIEIILKPKRRGFHLVTSAETAEDWYREHLHEAYQFFASKANKFERRTEHQREC